MAHWVADETGGDLFRVTAKEPYPQNYNETADRAKKEQDDDIRPEIEVGITPEQMAEYDTVFFGFPVCWYDLPMPMWTFLESYDFSGKTIIPFFSHEGSSNGAKALPTITEKGVGQGIIDSGIPREEIWVTSKLWPSEYGEGVTMQAIDDMLKRLQLDYLDCVYLHHPVGDYMGSIMTWKRSVSRARFHQSGSYTGEY